MSEGRAWTIQEDNHMEKLVQSLGQRKWKVVASSMNKLYPGKRRTGKSCKERWLTTQTSSEKKNSWSLYEEYIFFEAHSVVGNKWSSITKFLEDKTDNNLKNHFYSNLRKVLRKVVKDRYNYVDFKEKFKAFYTLTYIKNNILQVGNDKENDLSLNKRNTVNENAYIFKLLKRHNLQSNNISNYLNKLSNNIVKDKFVRERISEPIKDHSMINTDRVIHSLLYYELLNSGLELSKNNLSSQSKMKFLKFLQDSKTFLPSSLISNTLTENNKVFVSNLRNFIEGFQKTEKKKENVKKDENCLNSKQLMRGTNIININSNMHTFLFSLFVNISSFENECMKNALFMQNLLNNEYFKNFHSFKYIKK